MNGRNLPPQAYPQETYKKAYEWLSQQTPATKELANDMETLVSLYLQDQKLKERRKKKSEDSTQFKQELKSLAQGFKTFEDGSDIQQPPTAQQQADQAVHSPPPFQQPAPRPTTYKSTEYIDPKKYLRDHQQKLNQQKNLLLDPKIKTMLQTTQNKLNLSTEQEALNAIVSIGFEQIKKIFS